MNPELDIAKEYSHWLKDRITIIKNGSETVLSTPFLDPFNDGIRIYVDKQQNEFILHDNGDSLENLSCHGIEIENSNRRKKLIQRAIAGCAVSYNNGRLEIKATPVNLAQRVHFLLNAILRLNDLWMSKVPHSGIDFAEIVQEYFDQQNALYIKDAAIPGKTVEHPIDFIIPLQRQRERFIKLMGSPTLTTAKIISFTWFDLMNARPNAEKVVLLNDVRSPYDESSEKEFRQVSEQTMTILHGYSDRIYKWSERSNQGFETIWMNN